MANLWTLNKNGKQVNFVPVWSSILAMLKNFAESQPEKEAVVFEDLDQDQTTILSYQELFRLTKQTANFLKTNLRDQTTFAYAFPNSPQILILNLAAMMAGKIFVPLEVKRDSLEQKVYKLKATGSQLLFVLTKDSEAEKLQKLIPSLEIITIPNLANLKENLKNFPAEVSDQIPLDKECLILFTSGTTSLPKGVRLTQANLLANAEGIAEWLEFNQNDRFNILLPLHHINSTTFSLTTLLSGGTIVLSSRYSKSHFWESLAKQRCTGASIVPTIAYDMLSEQDSFKKFKNRLSQVQRIQIGSAPVNPTVVEEFIKKYQIPLIQGYGQTETALRSSGVPMDLSGKEYQEAIKLNTVGTELKWTNVTVLRPNGSEAKEDEEGEICVRGPVITTGYLNNPSANKQAFAYDWFHSGDMGYFKTLFGDKYFFLTSRITEIIKKGGVLISPLAIENTLLKNYPQLQRVFVVGFPDPRLGEDIGFVSTADEKIVSYVLEDAKLDEIKGLSPYETPKAGLSLPDSELPKTSTGKVQRSKIKELFGAKLRENSLTITSSLNFSFRLIKPEETKVLKQAVKLNNQAWGKNLVSSLGEFVSRAGNGILIGAFDKQNKLHGTISALQITKHQIENCQKWAQITGNGTLKTNNHRGGVLLCVAISTQPNPNRKPSGALPSKVKFSEAEFKKYLKSDKDYVVRFHRKPKGGFLKGARLIKILPRFRPEDKDALGYNLLMEYPALKVKPEVNQTFSCGTQLVEAALLYAFYHHLQNVYVLTRPAQAAQYFAAVS